MVLERRRGYSLCLSIIFILFSPVHADPFSIGMGIAAVGSGLGIYSVRCKFYECCQDPYLHPDFKKMEFELKDLVYGQHIVQATVIPSIRAHLTKAPSKPLVLSFNGATGSGKNHVARIIARNLYQKGMESRFVHHIVATAEFPDRSMTQFYQTELQKRLLSAVSDCGHSLFIFDEVDKIPEDLLDAIKPFLDYYDSVKGVDFRKCIFIFLSNAAGAEISMETVKHRTSGQPRDKLRATELERIVSEQAYNTAGGLKMSELISNHLIDHFIPFMPLEKDHVRRCTTYYMEQRWVGSSKDTELVDEVVSSLQYYPPDDPVFSSSGCKRVQQKADLALARKRAKYASQKEKEREHDEI